MNKDELRGRGQQALKSAGDSLKAGKALGCSAEGHAAVVDAMGDLVTCERAHLEYATNGQAEDIASAVAAKLGERKALLTVNGRAIPVPSQATVWRVVIIGAIVLSSLLGRGKTDGHDLADALVRILGQDQRAAKVLQALETVPARPESPTP